MDEAKIKAALEKCYDASLAPEAWPEALQQLAECFDAAAAMVVPKELDDRASRMPASPEYISFLDHQVRGGWLAGHYRATRGWPLLEQQSVVTERDLATDEERRQSAHFNDLYLKWDFPGFAAVGFTVHDKRWCVPLLRTGKQGDFTPAEKARLAQLSEHFSRIMRLSASAVQIRLNGLLAALDCCGKAGLAIGEDRRVSETNRKADSLLRTSRLPFSLRDRDFVGETRKIDNQLQDFLNQLSRRSLNKFPFVRTKNLSLRRMWAQPVILEGLVLPGSLLEAGPKVIGVVIVHDLSERRLTHTEMIAESLSLTVAEARLCEQLLLGVTLGEAADRLQIRIGTARQRLKAIFQKTNTHRQSELLLLLARLPLPAETGGGAAPDFKGN